MDCPICSKGRVIVRSTSTYEVDDDGTFFHDPQAPDYRVVCSMSGREIGAVELGDGGFGRVILNDLNDEED